MSDNSLYEHVDYFFLVVNWRLRGYFFLSLYKQRQLYVFMYGPQCIYRMDLVRNNIIIILSYRIVIKAAQSNEKFTAKNSCGVGIPIQ